MDRTEIAAKLMIEVWAAMITSGRLDRSADEERFFAELPRMSVEVTDKLLAELRKDPNEPH